MMDKKISFFWGNNTMSWLRYMTLWTFRKLNPDWEMRLFVCDQQRSENYWDCPNQQDFFNYTGPDHSDKLANISGLRILPWEVADTDLLSAGPSHKSNWFKWELMAKESGVYADLDIVFVKPMDEWVKAAGSADVSICYHRYFSIGLLGSSGKGDFYSDVYRESMSGFSSTVYQSAGVIALYRLMGSPHGNVDHLAIMRERYPDVSVNNFPMAIVYPWDFTQIPEMTQRLHTSVPAETIGIHWYAGHSTSQELNAELNAETVQVHQSTVAHFLRGLLNQ